MMQLTEVEVENVAKLVASARRFNVSRKTSAAPSKGDRRKPKGQRDRPTQPTPSRIYLDSIWATFRSAPDPLTLEFITDAHAKAVTLLPTPRLIPIPDNISDFAANADNFKKYFPRKHYARTLEVLQSA